jgi:hypothetical protein
VRNCTPRISCIARAALLVVRTEADVRRIHGEHERNKRLERYLVPRIARKVEPRLERAARSAHAGASLRTGAPAP